MLAPRPDQLLHLAKAVLLCEQDVAAREQDVARRQQELKEREAELHERQELLRRLRDQFTAAANGNAEHAQPEQPSSLPSTAHAPARRPSLARTHATIAQRVLVALEMEPRAFTPSELYNVLELPPPIETLRTTLWKMAQRGLIARPFPGLYCACQYEAAARSAHETA